MFFLPNPFFYYDIYELKSDFMTGCSTEQQKLTRNQTFCIGPCLILACFPDLFVSDNDSVHKFF